MMQKERIGKAARASLTFHCPFCEMQLILMTARSFLADKPDWKRVSRVEKGWMLPAYVYHS
jgi:hypothetical protein